MGAVGVSEHLLSGPPGTATGVFPHEIILVSYGLVPVHVPVPVTVRRAVNEPLSTEGVNLANAGFTGSCVQVPRTVGDVPPVHVNPLCEPLTEASTLRIGTSGSATQRVMLLPASTRGVWLHEI